MYSACFDGYYTHYALQILDPKRPYRVPVVFEVELLKIAVDQCVWRLVVSVALPTLTNSTVHRTNENDLFTSLDRNFDQILDQDELKAFMKVGSYFKHTA